MDRDRQRVGARCFLGSDREWIGASGLLSSNCERIGAVINCPYLQLRNVLARGSLNLLALLVGELNGDFFLIWHLQILLRMVVETQHASSFALPLANTMPVSSQAESEGFARLIDEY